MKRLLSGSRKSARKDPAKTPPRPAKDAAAQQKALTDLLAKAEAVLAQKGPEAAATLLSAAHGPLQPAERIALLGQSVLPRDPKTALLLAQQASARDRSSVAAWLLAGTAQDKLGFHEGAESALKIVVQSPRARPEQVMHAANLLARHGPEAQTLALAAAYRAYIALGRPLSRASQLLYIAQRAADWPLAATLTAELRAAFAKGQFDPAWGSPRTHANWCDSVEWSAELMRSFSRHAVPQLRTDRPRPEPLEGRRLRIGYLSSDFREHPSARLIKGMLRHHDRSRVQVTLYCSGWDDGSAVRREVLSLAEAAYSVSQLSDQAAADLMRSHKLDVLVDLNGPTKGQRLGILAQRPAPVLVHYLGWPGSLGGRIVDYVVGDAYVVPPAQDRLLPEPMIRLGSTYWVSDYDTQPPQKALTRAEAGLPQGDWRVIGMFNGIEKVSAEVWTCWMQILAQVPNALLWLLDPGAGARANIARATEAAGIDPRRIVIAPRLPQAAHLARLALCDLMLDPWPCGGHTTTSDALSVGVPVVALEGKTFAARVNGSLLRAAGLGSLVAPDVATYATLAVGLLRNRAELARVRDYVATISPIRDLFDSASKTRQFEAALREAVRRALAGQSPVTLEAPVLLQRELATAPAAPQPPASAPDRRLPLVLVCGPWGSGTSAVTAVLQAGGLTVPGPHVAVNDPRTPDTGETLAFRAVMRSILSETTLEPLVDAATARKALERLRDRVLRPQAPAGVGPLVLKHALSMLCLPLLAQVFDLRLVVVARRYAQIEATRTRRGWAAPYGRASAPRMYRALRAFVTETGTPCHVVPYHTLMRDPQALVPPLLAFAGAPATPEAVAAAIRALAPRG